MRLPSRDRRGARLEVFEEVAGKTELGRAHCAAPRELEGKRCLAVMEDELVVLLERPALARCPERGHLAARDDRQLERVLEGDAPPSVALAHHPPTLVDEREAAVQVVAHDGEERLEPASPDDRVCEALVDRERARELLELLAGELGERRLRDGDERSS